MSEFDSAPVWLLGGLMVGMVFLINLIQLNTPTAAVVVGLSCSDLDGDTASVPGTVTVQTDGGEQVVGDVCESNGVLVEQVCVGSAVSSVKVSCSCVSDVSGLGFCAS